MNDELEQLYGNSKIDITKFTKKNESLESELAVKFSLLKNEINGKLDYQIIEIDTTNLTKEDIELSVLNNTLFNTEKDALAYSKYLMTLDNLVAFSNDSINLPWLSSFNTILSTMTSIFDFLFFSRY